MLPFLSVLAGVGQVAGTVASFAGRRKEAKGVDVEAARKQKLAAQQRAAAEYQANQLDTAAGQKVAASQRTALEERRQAELMMSRALAVAAASGAGASNPSVVNIIASTAGEGAYRAAVAMWDGEDEARVLREKGKVARYTGYQEGAMSDELSAALSDKASSMRTASVFSLIGDVGRIGSSLLRR